MSTQKHVQIVKDFFVAMSRGDRQDLPKILSGSCGRGLAALWHVSRASEIL